MFGFSQETTSEKKGRINCGIQENCELVKVVYEKIKEKDVLCFYFEDAFNNEFKHIEWEPDSTKDTYAKKCDSLGKRIKHIATKFLPEEKAVIPQTETWEEFCGAVVALLGTSFKGVKVRIKLVMSNSNFPSFTPYTVFIESMKVPVGSSQLRIGKDERIKAVLASPDVVIDVPADDLPF